MGPASRVDQVPEVQRYSKKDFDIVQESADAGTVTVKGQVVSRFFWEVISAMSSRYGINVDAMFAPEVSPLRLDTRQATPHALPHPATPFDGGVHIPQNYIFWGLKAWQEFPHQHGSLHDFCTKSPERIEVVLVPSVGLADLNGACAMHDMCYETLIGLDESSSAVKSKYVGCDSALFFNARRACIGALGPNIPNLGVCNSTATVYYGVVAAVHLSHYW